MPGANRISRSRQANYREPRLGTRAFLALWTMGPMLTITVPDADLESRLSDLADRVRMIRWDFKTPFAEATDVDPAEVSVVVVPHYFTKREGYERLSALPNLRTVQLPSAGYEHALPHVPPGITVCNGRGVHDDGTAELALALTLASQRGLDDAVRDMPDGLWRPSMRSSLADRRAIVLGYGSVGQAIATRLRAFKVDVVPVASTARDTPHGRVHAAAELPKLLPTADIVVLITPLTDDTDGMVDADFLRAMPDGALLVNVGRGRLVDTDALLAEISSGRLRAALDVTEPEPLPADHPLWRTPGVIITPHVGGSSDATYPRFAELVRRQITRLLAGEEPENVVART